MTGDEEEERGVGGGRVGEESRVGGAEKVEREQMEEGEELMDEEAAVIEVQMNFFLSNQKNLVMIKICDGGQVDFDLLL